MRLPVPPGMEPGVYPDHHRVVVRISGELRAVPLTLWRRMEGPVPDPATFLDSDGCTSSPDTPLGCPVWVACYFHDHGYRHKPMGWSAKARRDLDAYFRRNVRKVLLAGDVSRWKASGLAWLYWGRVRVWGVRAWTGEPGLLGRIAEAWGALL